MKKKNQPSDKLSFNLTSMPSETKVESVTSCSSQSQQKICKNDIASSIATTSLTLTEIRMIGGRHLQFYLIPHFC